MGRTLYVYKIIDVMEGGGDEYRKRMLRLSLSRVELDNIWLTTDHHFRHANIIKFSARPFTDVTEMDEFLKERWNELVPPNDKVFILGDFSFSNPLGIT